MAICSGVHQMGRAFQRSESTGSIADNDNGLLGVRTTTTTTGPAVAGVGKLPALLIPPKIAASLDNRKLIGSNRNVLWTPSIGIGHFLLLLSRSVSEGMPPRKDFRQPRETDGAQGNAMDDGQTIEEGHQQTDCAAASIREHPMKKMQAKSHDGHGITLGMDEKPAPSMLLLSATSKDSLKLNRSNDLLAQSSTETLLDMLKAHAGIKDCSEETEKHINGVSERRLGNDRAVIGAIM